ncbi:DUF7529 family protein [Natrarchaeobaculum aegyptiacum]|uniref:Uncharacterized protein n=1 Tax=Natrarchaeobaculum aegyptiacum TaxID=745377 RepID=A0A2Z2HSW8_9EURY|nr:hypothetical protein [Natrarchaeobaculum aegyptiacum]ARS89873.1 hypothetical protein B1756_09090 [Natrarchaeobaculum aegyptiacum]
MTDDATGPADAPEPEWSELLADAADIADRYREVGWDAIVCDPADVAPNTNGERFGLEVAVADETTELLDSLLEREVTFDDAEVYYRPGDGADQRVALAVERATGAETAVFVPLTYSIAAARPVFETALLEGELLIHLRPVDSAAGALADADDPDTWVTFAHDDPSLFLEEADLEAWQAGSSD